MKTIKKKLGLWITLLLIFVLLTPSISLASNAVEKVDVLILFEQHVGKAEKKIIQAFGGEITYTDTNLPVIEATMPVTSLKGLQNNPNIVSITEVSSDDLDTGDVSGQIEALSEVIEPSVIHKINVLILFDHYPGGTEEALVRAFGGEIKYTYDLIPTIAASIPITSIRGLQKNPNIIAIEEDASIQTSEESYDWGVDAIEADLVHDVTSYDGTGIKVAVVDTGIAFSHPDLPSDVRGYNVLNPKADPIDDNGHGTHVAGTIAAIIGNNTGLKGIAPNIELYAVKVLNRQGSGYISDIIQGIQWCTVNGIEVVNNSYGSSQNPGISFELAYQNAEQQGVLLIGAAGNTGIDATSPEASTVGYPAAYPSVMAVAAVGSDLDRAYFSSVGEAVEIAAPGVNIASTYLKNRYVVLSGTSMAAPHVTGVAALLMQQNRDATIGEIRTQLDTTAQDLGEPGRDRFYGYGLLRADYALNLDSVIIPDPGGNELPVLTISSPIAESEYKVDEEVLFTANATDAEDGNLSENIQWRIVETGETFTGSTHVSSFIEAGKYTVICEAEDAAGEVVSAQVDIYVVDAATPELTNMQIQSIEYSNTSLAGGKINRLGIVVRINNMQQEAVPDVFVSIAVLQDNNSFMDVSGLTDVNGEVSFSFNKVPAGFYIVDQVGVEKSGYFLDESIPYKNDGIMIY